jgi:[ribosomal protein S5]-alanine N-acetyltransferase
VTTIRPLSAEDGPELYEFETKNRSHFARSVPDRGDGFFTNFDDRLEHLLVEQEAGVDLFFIVREEGGAVIGRVNLIDVNDGVAHLGYRIAEAATGRGHAKAAVRLVLEEARMVGIERIRAMTTVDNNASRCVLEACGFTRASGAPAMVEGHGGQMKEAVHYERQV